MDDADFQELSKHKWCYCGSGYAVRHKGSRMVLMHREIINPPEGLETDHKDMNRLNNQRSNLRACSRGENSMNRSVQSNNKSGFKGVDRNSKNTFRARITKNGVLQTLGFYATPQEAASAYSQAAANQHMDFARTDKTA